MVDWHNSWRRRSTRHKAKSTRTFPLRGRLVSSTRLRSEVRDHQSWFDQWVAFRSDRSGLNHQCQDDSQRIDMTPRPKLRWEGLNGRSQAWKDESIREEELVRGRSRGSLAVLFLVHKNISKHHRLYWMQTCQIWNLERPGQRNDRLLLNLRDLTCFSLMDLLLKICGG
jgi:hypothetical protein